MGWCRLYSGVLGCIRLIDCSRTKARRGTMTIGHRRRCRWRPWLIGHVAASLAHRHTHLECTLGYLSFVAYSTRSRDFQESSETRTNNIRQQQQPQQQQAQSTPPAWPCYSGHLLNRQPHIQRRQDDADSDAVMPAQGDE
jgi:hypothetical protein